VSRIYPFTFSLTSRCVQSERFPCESLTTRSPHIVLFECSFPLALRYGEAMATVEELDTGTSLRTGSSKPATPSSILILLVNKNALQMVLQKSLQNRSLKMAMGFFSRKQGKEVTSVGWTKFGEAIGKKSGKFTSYVQCFSCL